MASTKVAAVSLGWWYGSVRAVFSILSEMRSLSRIALISDKDKAEPVFCNEVVEVTEGRGGMVWLSLFDLQVSFNCVSCFSTALVVIRPKVR